MGIYIKGMEIPKVPTRFIIFADGRVEDEDDSAYKYSAVSVPAHGKLGDLNALAQQIEYERFHHTHTDSLTAQHHVTEYGHFLKAIIDTPAIISAEEE